MSVTHAPHDPPVIPRLIGWSLPLLGLAAVCTAFFWVAQSSSRHSGYLAMSQSNAETNKTNAAAARPTTIVRPVSCERLPNVPGKSITTVVVDFPPGAHSPRHRHPGSVTAFVLEGNVTSQLNDGAVETFGVGESWFEPPGAIHSFAENASMTEPASLLATFVADDDCGPLTIFE